MTWLRCILLIFTLVVSVKMSSLPSDVLFLVTEYLTIGELNVLAKVGGPFGVPLKRRLNVLLRKRMNPELRRALQTASVAEMLRLLDLFRFQYRINFSSLSRATFKSGIQQSAAELCGYYSRFNLHFKDPNRSHELYKREDMLLGLIVHFNNYTTCKEILKLLKFASLDDALYYFQTYKQHLPPENRLIIDRLQSLHDSFQIEVIKASILSRIK